MSVSLLEMLLGGGLLYAAIRCLQFLPLLAGNEKPATHCTGSLIALITAVVAASSLGSILKRIFPPVVLPSRRKRSAKKQPTPSPTPLPTPAPTPLPPGGGGEPSPPELPSPTPVPIPGGGEGVGATSINGITYQVVSLGQLAGAA